MAEEIIGELPIADLRWIVAHLDRFKMVGASVSDIFCKTGLDRTARKAGDRFDNAGKFFEIGLHGPEQPPAKIAVAGSAAFAAPETRQKARRRRSSGMMASKAARARTIALSA